MSKQTKEKTAYIACVIVDIISLVITVSIVYRESVKENCDESLAIAAIIATAFIVWSLIYVTNRPPEHDDYE